MGTFDQRKKKYELEIQEAKRIKEVVSKHLPLYEFRKGRSHTFISTIHYDIELYDYSKRATQRVENTTIRVKEYYYELGDVQSFESSPYCFVEIQQRVEGRLIKRRLRAPKSLVNPLFEGKGIWDQLSIFDPNLASNDYGGVFNELRRYFLQYTFNARSIINYRRTVFQEKEEELSVTFDEHLKVFRPVRGLYDEVESLNCQTLGEPIQSVNKVILGIQCKEGGYPEWLEKVL